MDAGPDDDGDGIADEVLVVDTLDAEVRGEVEGRDDEALGVADLVELGVADAGVVVRGCDEVSAVGCVVTTPTTVGVGLCSGRTSK